MPLGPSSATAARQPHRSADAAAGAGPALAEPGRRPVRSGARDGAGRSGAPLSPRPARRRWGAARASASTRPPSAARSACAAGASTTSPSRTTARPSIRAARTSCCSRRRAARTRYYAEFGWVGAVPGALPTADTVWTADAQTLTPAAPGDAHLGQRPGARLPARRSASTRARCSRSGLGREPDGGARHAASLRARLPPRQADHARLLRSARGPDRRPRRPGPAGIHLRQRREGAAPRRAGDSRQGLERRRRRLRRHHGQVLGGGRRPRPEPALPGQLHDAPGRRRQDLPGQHARRSPRRWRLAPAPRRRAACSPAPRRRRPSTPTRTISASRTSTS